MKTKGIIQKLMLNRQTVANLDKEELDVIRGGTTVGMCTSWYCPTYEPTCPQFTEGCSDLHTGCKTE